MALSKNSMEKSELKEFLDFKAAQFQTPEFITDDPISIPHQFKNQEDIEISGILTATISWGNRKAILKSANQMMNMLDNAPSDFIHNASETEIQQLNKFVYRTFQHDDLCGMIRGLRVVYANGGLEKIFSENENIKSGIANFRRAMLPYLSERTYKHFADVERGSAAKRINMFLRWMVRPSSGGVDFGIWKDLSASELLLPLDVHSGNVARSLGLLTRKQNDWKSVEEVTTVLRTFDPTDPVKYDFALFGLGIFENWK